MPTWVPEGAGGINFCKQRLGHGYGHLQPRLVQHVIIARLAYVIISWKELIRGDRCGYWRIEGECRIPFPLQGVEAQRERPLTFASLALGSTD